MARTRIIAPETWWRKDTGGRRARRRSILCYHSRAFGMPRSVCGREGAVLLTTFVLYLAVIVGVGVWFYGSNRDLEDFVLGGRRIGPCGLDEHQLPVEGHGVETIDGAEH